MSSTSCRTQFILRGTLGHNRCDRGPEFIAKVVREWIAAVGSM